MRFEHLAGRIFAAAFAMAALLTLCLGAPEAGLAMPEKVQLVRPSGKRVVKDQYLVTYGDHKNSLSMRDAQQGLSVNGAEVVRGLRRDRASFLVRKFSGHSQRENAPFVEFDPRDSFCEDLRRRDPSVLSCSPDWEVRALEAPNDPLYGYCWGLTSPGNDGGADAETAWDLFTGSNNVIVAIIDTGMDYNHPDLVNNVWSNPIEAGGTPGVDDDGNGYIDDIHGLNVSVPPNPEPANDCSTDAICGDPMDDGGHGTHVAGIIGAQGDNSVGLAGVNWTTKMMPLKFLNREGSGPTSAAILAIEYMLDMKQNRGQNVLVANNSWGGGGFSLDLRNAISDANAAGILFPAAAGNGDVNDRSLNNDEAPHYPSSYQVDNVISVSAYQPWLLANFSNFGPESTDIAAPGVDIASTYSSAAPTPAPAGTPAPYVYMSGTSMATPMVSGALALLQGYQFATNGSYLSVSAAKQRLFETAVPHSSFQGLIGNGGRVLHIDNLLRNVRPAAFEPEYCAESIPFDPPNLSAVTPEAIGDKDEAYSAQRAFDFTFPFFGITASSYTISTNGVLYLNQGASSDQYQWWPRNKAPPNSIAPFWNDLYARDAGQGVRTLKTPSKISFQWKALNYSLQYLGYTGGEVNVWLSIYPDGIMESFVSLDTAESDEALLQFASYSAIGASGSAESESVTFHYNTYSNLPSPGTGGIGVRMGPCDSLLGITPTPTTPPPAATAGATPTTTMPEATATPTPTVESTTPPEVTVPSVPTLASATLQAKKLRAKKTGAISYQFSGKALLSNGMPAPLSRLTIRCLPKKGAAKVKTLTANSNGNFSFNMKQPKTSLTCGVHAPDGRLLSNKAKVKG